MNTDRLISADDAMTIVEQTVSMHAIVGMRPFEASSTYLHIEFKRAWGIGCDLSISFDSGTRESIPRRGDGVDLVWVQRPRILVTWSSTERTAACATACIALYREVSDLAALLEARLAEELIGWREPDAAGVASNGGAR